MSKNIGVRWKLPIEILGLSNIPFYLDKDLPIVAKIFALSLWIQSVDWPRVGRELESDELPPFHL